MTSTNELEKKLLTRCYDSNNEILQILNSRYSTEGEQKPTILFKHIDKSSPNTKKRKLDDSTIDDENVISPERKRNTRKELKTYINDQLNNQRKLIKKIKSLQRDKTIKQIDISSLLDKYNISKFEKFIKMNEMWQSYIKDLLSTPQGKFQLNSQFILPKLVNADFNGCLITVLKSRNTNVVGIRGIVVWDSQHSFIICTPRGFQSKEWLQKKENENDKEINSKNELSSCSAAELVGGFKIIPKKYTLFGFEIIIPKSKENNENAINENATHGTDDLESLQFTILGSRFEVRSIDRSSKKFKNHSIDDIL
ncbi:POP4 [Candida pseudojiufengensis]|uniref:POP4 n=1 Tax=Candida pseudojiufengensis TaxID=497109 RepID=UPI002225291D|nr:POP4 [Candida pseudojiufengensis]KAI5963179.1 POP4 [Candida pseudojiufengensis]